VLALLRPIATALDYAHRQGFVHGNLRPSNILRTTAGTILLTDFSVPGLDHVSASAATTIVSALDAPEYASPEQARQQVGLPSIDLYVLGVILYEVLTGRPPFQVVAEGDSARNVLSRHLLAEPPSPREYNAALGPAVEMTLLRALAKRPEDRYPSGAALLYALNEAYEQDGGRRVARPGTGPLGQRGLRPDEAPAPLDIPATIAVVATNEGESPVMVAGETASASPLLLVSGSAAERSVSPTLAPNPAAVPPSAPPTAATVSRPVTVEGAAAGEPQADFAVGATLFALSRSWIVAMVGFFALCAGLACGLFFAIW
jgi:serine/threonine-protein kinase